MNDLRVYEQRKFALASVIRRMMAVAGDSRTLQDETRELLVRLAEDRLNLVLVGRFNRGKTSVMNALLGGDRLPIGVVPITSAITTVTYGSEEHALLRYEESGLPIPVRIDELPAYITQKENPGNERRLKVAEVYVPVDVLRHGLFLVDTPGLGSAIAENTRTTEAYLPEADALLLVTSYDSPLSDEEVRLLERAAASHYAVFVAVNKQDAVEPAARREVLAYVERHLSAIFDGHPPPTFSVSARDGVRGRVEERTELLLESGIPALEAALVGFILTAKGTTVLDRTSARVTSLLRRLPESAPSLALLNELRESIDETSAIVVPASGDSEAFERCTVCGSLRETMFDFMRRYQYVLSTDPTEQRRHAEDGGFCNVHTWQYEALASPRGVALSYPTLLRDVAERLVSRDGLGSPVGAICCACATRSRAEADLVADLSARLDRANADNRPTLCLPHLTMVSDKVTDPDERATLLKRHARVLERLAEDLQRFALRHDALRRQLLSDDERRAPLRALSMVAADRSIYAGFTVQ